MKVFQHKTRHWHFKVFFPALLMIQFALLAVGACLLMRGMGRTNRDLRS